MKALQLEELRAKRNVYRSIIHSDQGFQVRQEVAPVPLGRYGNEGELNPAAIFLASDEASYITGQNIKVDGGYTSV